MANEKMNASKSLSDAS